MMCPKLSSVAQEGVLHCSKWVSYAALLEEHELSALLEELEPCFYFPASGIVSSLTCQIAKQEILSRYAFYLEDLLAGSSLPRQETTRLFSLMASSDMEDFYAIQTKEDRFLIKARKPVIQIQLYYATISSMDHKIYPMVLSPSSFTFGLQFSYPQIYEDPKLHQFHKPISVPFKKIVQWFRSHTKPAELLIQGKRVCAPFRVGKEGRSWVSIHPGLA